MLASRTSRRIALTLLAVLLVAAGTAVAQDRTRARDAERDGGRAGERGRGHRLLRGRAAVGPHARDARRARLQRLMDATDDQVRAALDASREAARVREEGKAKSAAVLVAALREAKDATPEQRTAIRGRTREKLRALRAEARGPLTEAGRKVLANLTQEQRAKLDGALAKVKEKRGISVDEDRIALRFGMRLAHPWSEALLKARLEAGAAGAGEKR